MADFTREELWNKVASHNDNWDIEENNDYLDLKNCDLSNLNLNCST